MLTHLARGEACESLYSTASTLPGQIRAQTGNKRCPLLGHASYNKPKHKPFFMQDESEKNQSSAESGLCT